MDVFFEVPDQALPERSVYQVVTAPAILVKRSLFASKGHVTCDWAGILTRHLARGWRLVDVFCEVPVTAFPSTPLSPTHSKMQTVWFFEKPESRSRDDSAVYEGTILEHWIQLSSSSSPSSSSLLPGSATACLGGGRGEGKKGGSVSGKRNSSKRVPSFRKKSDDAARAEADVRGEEVPGEGSKEVKTAGTPGPDHGESDPDKNHVNDSLTKSSPSPSSDGPPHGRSAGWEGVIRSMGEKGWELASIINTLDSQVVSGTTKVKVLLVFQRRISLVMSVKGRRTSDGLALR